MTRQAIDAQLALAVLSLLIALLFYGISQLPPSCEARGGHLVFSHYLTMVTRMGIINTPIYECIGAEKL